MQIPVTATDFMFDNKNLSSFGMMICSFNGASLEEISIGNKITYTTIKPPMRDKNLFIGSSYAEPISTSFQICKNPCNGNNSEKNINPKEMDALIAWLVRNDGYYKFKLYQEGYEDMFFNAYFSDVQAVKFGGLVYGLTLTITADSPYAYMDTVIIDLDMKANQRYQINNLSSEIGNLSPKKLKVQCMYSGDFSFTNITNGNKKTTILNCEPGEILTFDCTNKIITSSNSAHSLYDDFNYNYFNLVKTYEDGTNIIFSNMDCKFHLEYNPIRKVGIV